MNSDERNGRQDFDNTVQELIIPAGRETLDISVTILINDDQINEAREGFMVVVRANEAQNSPQDISRLQYLNEGVMLAYIVDDDGKSPSTFALRP